MKNHLLDIDSLLCGHWLVDEISSMKSHEGKKERNVIMNHGL